MPSARVVLVVAILSVAFIAFITSLFAQMLVIGLWLISAGVSISLIIKALADYQEARAKHRIIDFVESQQRLVPNSLAKDIKLPS